MCVSAQALFALKDISGPVDKMWRGSEGYKVVVPQC